MSFLRRLFRPGVTPASWPPRGPITAWPPTGASFVAQVSGRLFDGHGAWVVHPVGATRYQQALEEWAASGMIDGARNEPQTALLLPEPDSPKDPMAVRVCLVDPDSGRWAVVAYLSSQDGRAYRPAIDRLAAHGDLLSCPALMTGGWDQGAGGRAAYGLFLRLPSPAALAMILDAAEGVVR